MTRRESPRRPPGSAPAPYPRTYAPSEVPWNGWSLEDVLALNPCPEYTRERLLELGAERERLGIREVCDLAIPAKDRLWLLCRAPWEVIAPAVAAIVARAVRTYARPHPVTREWAERWLSGEDRSREAASAAALAAARAAEWTGAPAWWASMAAEAAAKAAGAEAWAAAWAAAEAAWVVDADRAVSAERERQIEDFRALEAMRCE